ncbi:molybdenum cofactor sulfurase-like isoform X4 [Artemia franciscana]|uniref:molybdenum cofactor sulfurase-like isoform X4 n=1 Tax=Artemia franciscana TaxID=6661 RepID=UPI0032DB43D4
MSSTEVYFDHAGAAAIRDELLESVFSKLKSTKYGNPHSHNSAGKRTLEQIEQSRFRILSLFKTSASDYSVIFTSGATAGLKIVAEYFDYGETSNANFYHSQEIHTSCLGMREYAEQKNVPIVSLKLKEFTDYFQSMEKRNNEVGKSLVAFPAQCNFTGYRMPLNLIEIIKQKLGVNAYVCLDAASFVSTTVLDLSEYKPDFVCISFYKIFGCPTGLGCLLVKKTAEEALLKTYYGGGTVFVAASTENFHVKRKRIEERFEDGTLPYLEIVSLNACFDWLETNGSQKVFSNQPYELAALAFRYMQSAFHSNSSPMFEVYSLTDYTDSTSQGGIISFNMRDSNGHYVGYAEVDSVVTANKFCVRTGCFCNPGACQTFLKLTKQDLLEHFKAGHVCGDNNDLVEGKPTGAIRLSFGPTNTYEEVEKLLKLLNCTFKGYTLISKNRSLMGRGGLAFIIKDDIKFKVREDLSLWIEDRNLTPIELQVHQAIQSGKNIKLEKIRLYPVKSCSYQEVKSWPIEATGLSYDRQWMIIGSTGASITQKREPRLCLITPTVNIEKKTLTLNYPGVKPVTIIFGLKSNQIEAKVCKSRVCGDSVDVNDCGEEVYQWLQNIFGSQGYRLVQQSAVRRQKKEDNKTSLSLANESQYLLVNKNSVSKLMEQMALDDATSTSLDEMIDRFRGNLIVSGLDPFEEEEWESFKVSGIIFKEKNKGQRKKF